MKFLQRLGGGDMRGHKQSRYQHSCILASVRALVSCLPSSSLACLVILSLSTHSVKGSWLTPRWAVWVETHIFVTTTIRSQDRFSIKDTISCCGEHYLHPRSRWDNRNEGVRALGTGQAVALVISQSHLAFPCLTFLPLPGTFRTELDKAFPLCP